MVMSISDRRVRFPLKLGAATVAATLASQAAAVDTLRTAPVVVSATRVEQSSFDLPAAIDAIDSSVLNEASLKANVSEYMSRIPGTYVRNRETFAQEQQITIRGFGARSGFGTRGVRIYVDEIPASTPDGQGGSGNFDFSSASRIEVLRGPFSALYGNHSGGIVQIFTEDGPKVPTLTGEVAFGSYDTQRYGLKFGGTYGHANAVGSFSYLTTDGYREHSSSTRYLFNAKFGVELGDAAKLTIVANYLDQPEDLDPLTLNAQQVAENPRQARAAALQFNTRRSLDNKQMGLVYERRLNGEDTIRALAYGGQRNNIGYLGFRGFPLNTTSGGVSELSRDYGGFGLRWTRKTTVFGDQPFTITSGADYDLALEGRKGYLNENGVIGLLRRNEDNRSHAWGLYTQMEWQPIQSLSAFAGLRYTQVAFRSKDYYITATNPDDSGAVRYDAWTPVVGALVRVNPILNVYANAGRSFETPTFIELAYQNSASGLNFALKPSTSNHYELGAKAFVTDNTRLNLAFFQIYTNDEIVVDVTSNGRTTYKNASRTERTGLELAADSDLGNGFFAYASYTYLRAVFGEPFTSSGGSVSVPAGSQVPGVPRSLFYVDLSWREPVSGVFAGVEQRISAKVYANDVNSDYADGYQITDVRVGIKRDIGGFLVQCYGRVNNLFGEKYIGGVAVNDANGFFYAPAAQRNFLIGASASMKF